jgi:hypothetical protein
MSDSTAEAPRSVSLVTVFAIMGCFALFLLVVKYGYLPHQSAAANTIPAEKLPEELAWKATHASKQAALAELRKKQAAQGMAYAWVDQKAGVVQLPIARAMELVARDAAARK